MDTKVIIGIIIITLATAKGWSTGGNESGSYIAKKGFKIFGASFAGIVTTGVIDLFIESQYISLGYKIFGIGLVLGITLGLIGQVKSKT